MAQITVSKDGVPLGVATVEGEAFLGTPVSITIHTEKGYTHHLIWELGDYTGTVGENLTDSALWTPPLLLATAFSGSNKARCTLICYSFRDGVMEPEPQISCFYLTVPEKLAPQVEVTVTDSSGAWDVFGAYLEKVSKLELEVSTQLFYGAEVVSTAITLDGAVYTGAALTLGEHTLAVAVTDSRNMVGQWQQSFTAGAYTLPQLEVNASRCLADGTLDDTGDHALVSLSGSVTPLEGNTATLLLTYGKHEMELPVEPGPFSQTALIPADPNEPLFIKGRIADAIKSVMRWMTLSTGYPTMEFLYGGKGIAFGTVATGEGFECAMDARFTGHITDGQGRNLAARYDLANVVGMYLTPIYGRVLEVMGAGYLQLKFTCNRNRNAGDMLYTCSLPLTQDITVTDVTGNRTLLITPTGVITPNYLPTGTYTFSCMLY